MIRTALAPVPSPTVAVTAADTSLLPRAQVLAAQLAVPCLTTPTADAPPYLLVQTATQLELHDVASGERVCVSFARSDLMRVHGRGRQPLARALGRGVRRVIDATAGLGADTILLAAYGCQVTAIERHPVIAALLRDGIDRAIAAGLLLPVTVSVVCGDAREQVYELAPAHDAVFIDPMFPSKRKKSAAVRKEMRMLRALVGDDADAAALVSAARAASPRVIVKRPVQAPPLGAEPTASYAGKLVRYDVYTNRS